MPSQHVFDAVNARLAGFSGPPLAETNAIAPSPAPNFYEVEYPVCNRDQVSCGRPAVFRETGVIRFVIRAPAQDKAATAIAMGWATELFTLFDAVIFDGIETKAAAPPVLDERNRDNTYYRIPFVVPYQYDTIK
jgi:hypothetical protein